MKTKTAIDPTYAVVSAKGMQRIYAGHLWVYRSDVTQRPRVESGAVVRVVDQRGRFLAVAHFGEETEITLRVLTTQDEAVDAAFWQRRLSAAHEWRKKFVTDTDAYRVIHGEGDLLPGLIVDRYGDCLSLQTLTRGMDAMKQQWVALLVEQFQPRLIVERNDAKVRQLEGLPMLNSLLYARNGDLTQSIPEFTITENGLQFAIDLLEGQKTGAFLDQRENRAAARAYAFGRALDCFSFHGSFALHLAQACTHVTAIDVSEPAVERAQRNTELNGLTNVEFIAGNVFDKLRDLEEAGAKFDTIVLDPPAFAKNRGALDGAYRGYKEINLRALKLLNVSGVLITCSCSYHVNENLFLQMLAEAAHDAHRQIQVVEKRTQGRDHPILLTVPETYYLKCVILRVL
ncbi:MAG: class I SAM-dependent rRNA methyltransferase [Acidobacteria bacterium]|nr:class I SAM-dependent rRNA methyltransferase [Acidobacteriota bacterium]